MAAHGQDYLACILSYLDNSGLKNGLAFLGKSFVEIDYIGLIRKCENKSCRFIPG